MAPRGNKNANKGAPSRYTKEVGDRICAELVNRKTDGTTRSLRDVCKLKDMPHEATIYRWLNEHRDFCENYARARETLADMNACDIVHIADTEEDSNRARVRIDARKWFASKVAPKKYGDKLAVGGDEENPIQHRHAISWMTEEDAKARVWA